MKNVYKLFKIYSIYDHRKAIIKITNIHNLSFCHFFYQDYSNHAISILRFLHNLLVLC